MIGRPGARRGTFFSMTQHTRTLAIASLLLMLLGSGGCIAIGGSRKSASVQPTTGQQLVDLKRALDCGAITPSEFDTKKTALLSTCAQ